MTTRSEQVLHSMTVFKTLRKTDITLHATTKNYHVDVSNISGYHSFQLKVRNTDKRILLLYQTEKKLYKTVCKEKD